MLLQNDPPLHLTYCLNIHPGETWAENLQAIKKHAVQVRDKVAREAGPAKDPGFGLGLRLSAIAASELSQKNRLRDLRGFLDREGMYVFTINGFPFSRFHQTEVKENVYSPDWQDGRRRDYTMQLADILAELLPEGVAGSISTVPCSYKPWIVSPQQVGQLAAMLAEVAAHLASLRQRTGHDICLALEPEPDCYLETTDEAIAFFQGPLVQAGRQHLKFRGFSVADADQCLRQHLGLCLDTAHAAVEFEDLPASLRRLQQAGIRIGKVQLSAALAAEPTAAAMTRLSQFVDKVYLHQVKARRRDGRLESFRDLPEALAACGGVGGADRPRSAHAARPGDTNLRELRVHFHVPLFCEDIAPLASTTSLMTDEFWRLLKGGITSHAEIETYTFGVLPPELQTADVTESILREYQWVLGRMGKSETV